MSRNSLFYWNESVSVGGRWQWLQLPNVFLQHCDSYSATATPTVALAACHHGRHSCLVFGEKTYAKYALP